VVAREMQDRAEMLDVILKPGRERALEHRHPWVLSGAVGEVRAPVDPRAGEWARVLSSRGAVMGYGHYSPQSSLRVRMLCFGPEEPGEGFLAAQIARALARREGHPLLAETDAVRLVNAEGDDLPGLVVDRFADVLAVQITSVGMDLRREEIAAALRAATGASCAYERAEGRAARREGMAVRDGALWGGAPTGPVPIRERDRGFEVDVVHGQKTGFYLDQRDARDLVTQLAAGRNVLDLFCYTGGFAVAAARGGAASVTLVDSSAPALERAEAHLAANAPECSAHTHRTDAFEFVRRGEESYDLLVVDPPPLARRAGDVQRASRAYKDVISNSLRRAAPGAFALVFACSHHVSPELFRKLVFGASLDAGRTVEVLRSLGAPADHPVSIDHPEGHYLTGLLLRA
jgi:23S rRNA (cytosine1962-C5)-methyltransferase